MNLMQRAHFIHRAYRYRYRSERQEMRCLLRADLRSATVVDAGANRGAWSWWMHKQVGRAGRVIAFEPQPELGTYLLEAKRAFALHRLIVVNQGLSSKSGRRRMIRPRAHWVGGSLELDPGYPDSDNFLVDLTSLDEYFSQHAELRPIRFLKCDIQGHEYECFLGGRQVLSEDRPEIVFECLDPVREQSRIFPLLNSLGYEGFFLSERSAEPIEELPRQHGTLNKGYYNCHFAPPRQDSPQTGHEAA